MVMWLCAAACGDRAPVGDDGNGTAEVTGPSVTGDSTEGPGMTGPIDTEGEPTAGTTMGDETTMGEPGVCDDQLPRGEVCQSPGTATIGWQVRIDGRELLEADVSGACTVSDVLDDGTTTTVALDCTSFLAEIDLVTMNPHTMPSLYVDDPVDLRASSYLEDEAVVARYLTLRRGGLALAAFDASQFSPPSGFDFQPVALQVLPTDCPSQPTECVHKQGAALAVDFDGQTELFFQGQEGFVGQLTSYRVIAGRVERIFCFPEDCGYSYAEWFVQGLVFRIPEG
jgi:hypothetical protein